MLSLVFVVVASVMLAKATGKTSSFLSEFLLTLLKKRTAYSVIGIFHFSGDVTGKCDEWFETIDQCLKVNWESELMACCKNQGVPNECARYCDKSLLSACIDWSEQIHKCWIGNEGHVCCEEQGVPDKCIPYCE